VEVSGRIKGGRSPDITCSRSAALSLGTISIALSTLWRSQGKVQQARELLAPVCGWFTEGHDTRDLKTRRRCWGELA
jgi:hypothetical protein